MKSALFSTVERRFASDCVLADRRLDGRSRHEARQVGISLGPSWGFAEVVFDKTQAVASTKVEAITPSSDRRSEGSISIAVNLSATSSEAAAREALHRASGPSSVEMRNAIEGFVRDSRAIDTEALCILAGVKVWSVRVDVDVINDDGNVMDVCMVAVMASLMHARRPDVTVNGKEVRIHSLDEREPVPLPVHHVPLSVTFALFGAGKPYEDDTVVLDPVKKEESSSNGSVSFSFNSQGEVCGLYKAGGLPLQPIAFAECTQLAVVHVSKLTGELKKALAAVAAEHPLSTVRPMLMEAEPVAILNKHGKDDEMPDVPMSLWNATPAADEEPPMVEMSNGRHENDESKETVKSMFEHNEEARHALSGGKDVTEVVQKKNKKMIDAMLESESDSDSDDDLADAVISRPKGGGARRKK